MSTEVPTSEFQTHSLFFAAWLLCGRASYHQHNVTFLRIQRADSRTKAFVFRDPDGQGPELEEEFKKNPPVRVITLKNAYNFLREQMKEMDRGGAR